MSKNIIISPFNKGGIMHNIMHKRNLLIYGVAVIVLIVVGSLVWYLNRSSADMMQGAGIQGMVTNSDNLPVAGASVYIYATEEKTGQNTTTNAQGNYKIMGIEPRDYNIGANFGGGAEWADPQTVTVKAGTVITVNLKLKKAEPMGIKGQIKDINGNPIAGAFVKVFTISLGDKEAKSKVDGYYEVLFRHCDDEILDVVANAAGYETGYVNDISLKCKEVKTIDITLKNATMPGQSGGQSGTGGANPGGQGEQGGAGRP